MNRYYFLAAALTLTSGCSSFHQNTAYNVWEESSAPARSPASLISLGTPTFQNYDINFVTSTLKLCGLSFDKITLKSSHPDYIITPKWIENQALPFRYPVPDSLMSIGEEDKSVLLRAGKTRFLAIKNPLFPDIPVFSAEKEGEVCQQLKSYHQNFFSVFKSQKHEDTESVKVLSKGFELHNAVSYLSRRNQGGDYFDSVVFPYDSLIIYDDLYQSEVEDIARVHRRSGYTPKLLKLSKLPGHDAKGELPEECSGDYLGECYRFSPGEKQERISYIPGLIKAYLRTEKKKTNLKGVFLVGNPALIGSFYNSDIFYMLPDLKTHSTNESRKISESEQIKNYQLSDVIPVGRLVTKNDLQGHKDPVVAEYARKIHQWHENLPVINRWELSQDGTLLGVSFEEQLLSINAYLNRDIGYSSSDSYYNIKFMSKMRIARNNCGGIGEALRQTVYEMIKKKTDGAGNWQLVNRQFQGSPLNLIAKYPHDCQKISHPVKEKNELIGRR